MNKFQSGWKKINSQFIDKDIREKTFLILSVIVLSFVAIGCLIVNLITNEYPLVYFSLASFIAYELLLGFGTFLFFKKKKINNLFVTIPFVIITIFFVFSYLFVAPADSLYFFWICIIPICFCLSFGLKKGIIYSLSIVTGIACIFYIPALSELTRTEPIESHYLLKVFFLVYYLMATAIGGALAYVNIVAIRRLDELKDVYYEEANTDRLTGLRNQAFYLTYINNLHNNAKTGETIGLMFIDIDDFKIYNDKFGHEVGNDVLKAVANKLNEVPHALCVRWGGDEFAIVERNLTRDEFIAKANYLLKSVEAIPSGVTISIGLAYYVVDEEFDFQRIFNDADMKAIRAKGKGKNCIVIND